MKHSIVCVFILQMIFSESENLFAQNSPRNATPGSRYKKEHATKGSNRYSSSSGSSNAENPAAGNGSAASQKTGTAAKQEFMKQSGFPMGRPGYVLDYIVPTDKGGCDCVENMQWITIAAAKAQGKLE